MATSSVSAEIQHFKEYNFVKNLIQNLSKLLHPSSSHYLSTDITKINRTKNISNNNIMNTPSPIVYIQQICVSLDRTLTPYLEQPSLLDAHLKEFIDSLSQLLLFVIPKFNQTNQLPIDATHLDHIHKISFSTLETPITQNLDDVETYLNHTTLTKLNEPTHRIHDIAVYTVLKCIYLFVKVRGFKKIVKFLPNEVQYVEAILICAETLYKDNLNGAWHSLYVCLLWLSLLLLAPFDLKSIDSNADNGSSLGLVNRIRNLAVDCIKIPSKVNEIAAYLLAKLFARPDTHTTSIFIEYFDWCNTTLVRSEELSAASNLNAINELSGIFKSVNEILKVASSSNIKPHLPILYDMIMNYKIGDNAVTSIRKLRISCIGRLGLQYLPNKVANWRYQKGIRRLLEGGVEDATTHEVVEADSMEIEEIDGEAPDEVEEVISVLLEGLVDTDIVVRWAAAKGIGRVTMRLNRELGDQVVGHIISLSELDSGSAWHGSCLALAELIRRGLLLPERLQSVVPLISSALLYERREVTSSSSVVRDAACYVCWSLARTFSSSIMKPYCITLANMLLQVALFDSGVNCRRAAAAAIQEHVGRQGIFPDGVTIVGEANFFSVSYLRSTYLKVAPKLAELKAYQPSIIDHLINKRLVHSEIKIRQLAALSLEAISPLDSKHFMQVVFPLLLKDATSDDIALIHGSLLGLCSLIKSLEPQFDEGAQKAVRNIPPKIEKLRLYRFKGGELIRQAVCRLIQCIAKAKTFLFFENTAARYLQTIKESLRQFSEDVQVAAAEALYSLAKWRLPTSQSIQFLEDLIGLLGVQDEHVAARRGYVLAIGMLPAEAVVPKIEEVFQLLCDEATGLQHLDHSILFDAHTRRNALLSLTVMLQRIFVTSSMEIDIDDIISRINWKLLFSTLCTSTKDDEMDVRGDVGSWIRELSSEAITLFFTTIICGNNDRCTHLRRHVMDVHTNELKCTFKHLLSLAFERMDRVRGRASYLIYRMSCYEDKEKTRVFMPLQSYWIWWRVFYTYSYEISPLIVKGIEYTGGASEPYSYQLCLPFASELEVCFSSADAAATSSEGLYSVHQKLGLPEEDEKDEEVGEDRVFEVLNPYEETYLLSGMATWEGGGALQQKVKPAGGRYLRIAGWSSVEVTFPHLLQLICVEEVMCCVLRGVSTSVGGGTGGATVVGARRCFIEFLEAAEEGKQREMKRRLGGMVVLLLEEVEEGRRWKQRKEVYLQLLLTGNELVKYNFIVNEIGEELMRISQKCLKSFKELRDLRIAADLLLNVAVCTEMNAASRKIALKNYLMMLKHRYPILRQHIAEAAYSALITLTEIDLKELMIEQTEFDGALDTIINTAWLSEDVDNLNENLKCIIQNLKVGESIH